MAGGWLVGIVGMFLASPAIAIGYTPFYELEESDFFDSSDATAKAT